MSSKKISLESWARKDDKNMIISDMQTSEPSLLKYRSIAKNSNSPKSDEILWTICLWIRKASLNESYIWTQWEPILAQAKFI